ncbi:MAG: arginine--tRNA ligase [Elusimicrobiota bacterium]|nr:arginine--tRNA ligase [Endomicrobiia bacterium]MDW8165556.1 arginine--tRNA ligase [Elusimicrobiota bacterium]
MIEKIKKILNEVLNDSGFFQVKDFEVKEPPPNINFEFSTNLPILISKKYNVLLEDVYNKIENSINNNYKNIFIEINFTSPGFLNFNLDRNFYYEELKKIFFEKEEYPCLDKYKNKKVLVEFISANPTGPLHIGHGRCAVLGDVLSNILKKMGCEVYKEYYINDRGRQIDILTASVVEVIILENLSEVEEEVFSWCRKVLVDSKYKGEYIKEISVEISKIFKKITLNEIEKIKTKIVELIMDNIKNTLKRMGIDFDSYLNETELYKSGLNQKIKNLLQEFGLIEEKEGALWVKAKNLGDEKDRVIIKSDGEPTYFFSDIIYHYYKIMRNYNWLINIWGTDHHGYVERLRGTVELISKKLEKEVKLDIILYQLVSLITKNQRVSMSTREGRFISLDEVLDEVGSDVTRFFLLTKSPNTHLDFDLELAKEHSLKNPVYYTQYAHTRCVGILKEASNLEPNFSIEQYIDDFRDYISNLDKTSYEFKLVKTLCVYSNVLEKCIENFSPHYLCNYLIDLSKIFHKFYETTRVISSNKIDFCRLLLVVASKIILKNSLSLLNIQAPEKM